MQLAGRRVLAAGVAAVAALGAGCDSGEGDGDSSADARPAADGAIDGDAGPCTATAGGYGDAGLIAEAASRAELTVDTEMPPQPRKLAFTGTLNDDQDLLVIELIAGYGVFTGTDLVTGTFPLTGDELNYSTCGACVRVLGDVDVEGNVAQILMATGGSLTVTALGHPLGQRFQATLVGASFEHVTIDPSTYVSTPVGDGCGTSVGNAGADVMTIAAP